MLPMLSVLSIFIFAIFLIIHFIESAGFNLLRKICLSLQQTAWSISLER